MDRYRRRIAMLSVGAQLGCPVRRRTEGEIEIARPVEIVFETTRSHTPTRFFFSRVLQPFVVKLLGKTVYQDMRRMEELFRNSNDHSTIAKRTAHAAIPARRVPARNTTRASTHRPAVSAEYPWASCSHLTSTIPHLLADHFLVDLGRAGTTTLPLRLGLRRGPVDLGEAGEHRDLCLGVAQRISPGQPPASAVPRGIFRQTQRWYTTNDVR